eukprot:4994253-Prymnesium_polylepis.1
MRESVSNSRGRGSRRSICGMRVMLRGWPSCFDLFGSACTAWRGPPCNLLARFRLPLIPSDRTISCDPPSESDVRIVPG